MPRIAGVDIPNDKQTVHSLTYLYGVGSRVARDLCQKAGIPPEKKARDLGEDETETYTLVFPDEADINEGRLSVLAPLGMVEAADEVVGRHAGDDMRPSHMQPVEQRQRRVEREPAVR